LKVPLAYSRSQCAHLCLREAREERCFSQNYFHVFSHRSDPPLLLLPEPEILN